MEGVLNRFMRIPEHERRGRAAVILANSGGERSGWLVRVNTRGVSGNVGEELWGNLHETNREKGRPTKKKTDS